MGSIRGKALVAVFFSPDALLLHTSAIGVKAVPVVFVARFSLVALAARFLVLVFHFLLLCNLSRKETFVMTLF